MIHRSLLFLSGMDSNAFAWSSVFELDSNSVLSVGVAHCQVTATVLPVQRQFI